MGLEYEFIQSSFIVESSSKFFLEKKNLYIHSGIVVIILNEINSLMSLG